MDEEDYLELESRHGPGILTDMNLVWYGTLPDPPTRQQLRLQESLVQDARQFQAQFVALTKGHLNNLAAWAARSKEVAELKRENALLKEQIKAGPAMIRGERDEAEERVIDLLESLREP